MIDPAELQKRYGHIVALGKATQVRASFFSLGTEELEEIGFLTMRLAALEETIALWCETLLIRPELSGFHPAAKPVLTKQFSEKLGLLRMLIVAASALYGLDTDSLEKSIVPLKEVGEDRNAIIHGLLTLGEAGAKTFRVRNRDVEATLTGLRALTQRCQDSTAETTKHFAVFYQELVEKKSTLAEFEKRMQVVLKSWLSFHVSSFTVRMDTVALRKAQLAEIEARRKLEESKKQLAEAKKVLRNTRAREKRKASRVAPAPSPA